MDKEQLFQAAAQSIVDADESRAMHLLEESKREGFDLLEVLMDGFGAGNEVLGERFDKGVISLPELIYAAEVMKNITAKILEVLDEDQRERIVSDRGTIVLATVAGDVHDIGKGIVASTLRTAGFKVVDLGCEVKVETILDAAEKYDADIIGTSALLTSTLPEQKKLEKLLVERGEKERFITMVGGAPCTTRWARKIGADGYSENALDAVRVALELIERRKSRQEDSYEKTD
ncbi:cobalamin B12-binding domain-containing protein [Hornefia butyriciproducens]|uniref:cobalamin B12-binding domain-containing protein n=1 Tax=Hornefia butyriciproducens TaxID=2652293 RepID=UPI0023EFC4E4|nr:cobalamin-dependent protein [Hornefia butyriciproducens]MDD6299805.1 cobalamin-dependent protein [Hornefia butyriciproducens]